MRTQKRKQFQYTNWKRDWQLIVICGATFKLSMFVEVTYQVVMKPWLTTNPLPFSLLTTTFTTGWMECGRVSSTHSIHKWTI
jgi:hypothetical protein